MALTKAGWRVVYIVDYPASSIIWVVFWQGSAATLFRWGGRVFNSLMWHFLVILYTKVYENRFIFRGVIRNIKWGRLFETQCMYVCMYVSMYVCMYV